MVDDPSEIAAEGASASAPRPHTRPRSSGALWLETPHWLLMTVTPGYARLIAQLHERNGDHFRMAMCLDPAMTQASFWEPLLGAQQEANSQGTGLFLVGFPKKSASVQIGCVISFSGIVHHEFETCWLGFRMDRELEGKGLMYEALDAAIAAVFRRFGLHRIMASHLPENHRSAQLLRRLGFGIEGYSRDFMKIGGEWRDNVLTALIAPRPAASSLGNRT